jgi:hypothetical protein
MKYLKIFATSLVVSAIIYFSGALLLTPAPISAEYWVREMTVIKRSIAAHYRGQRKLIIAAGSNVLFGVDTVQLSRDLGIPVINYGLHAGLPLEEILSEAAAAAERNDTVILPLEREYYCDSANTKWRARNAIAWDRDRWRTRSILQRLEAISSMGPGLLFELGLARISERWFPGSIEDRLEAFHDQEILEKFIKSPPPTTFDYSAYHLDELGNMQHIDGSQFTGQADPAEQETEVCPGSLLILRKFVQDMNQKGVAVYFANTPYVKTRTTRAEEVEKASREFAASISPLGTVLDDRNQVVFNRGFFLNTDLHLNTKGRALRTSLLEDAIKRDPALSRWLDSRRSDVDRLYPLSVADRLTAIEPVSIQCNSTVLHLTVAASVHAQKETCAR